MKQTDKIYGQEYIRYLLKSDNNDNYCHLSLLSK